MDNIYMIAGLGNPGARYDGTRHNVGFEAIDVLSQKHGIKVSKIKFKALLGEGNIGGHKVVLIKPQTFMNLSGESLREAVNWYKLPMTNLIVIYDDIDLDPGILRVRPTGSAGTHNGMKSIIYQLQKDDFPRVRIGVGGPPPYMDLADYVLGRFSTTEEAKLMTDTIKRAAEAAELLISDGINAAMNKYNVKASK